jgi:glycerophosphoryl diester phosphodiesterase
VPDPLQLERAQLVPQRRGQARGAGFRLASDEQMNVGRGREATLPVHSIDDEEGFPVPMRTSLCLLMAAVLTGALPGAALARHADDDDEARPIVVAHRGASGYRPEHTLAAYALGARLGADYVEPDLVITKDGVLVARHEPEIEGTTNVETKPGFADRRTTKVIDGQPVTGFFVEDFTLAELKTLRAEERIPQVRQRNTIYNGRYAIPTLQEVIDLSRRLSRELGREVGIYPETKHPAYFRAIGKPLEEPLVRILKRNGLHRRNAKVFVQSFEVKNLQMLNRQIDSPIVQLLGAPAITPADGSPTTYGEMATPDGLRKIRRYADGVGPSKDYIVPRGAATAPSPLPGCPPQTPELTPTAFVDDAHEAGLLVHPYTFRNENCFQSTQKQNAGGPADYGDAFAEYAQFYGLRVDGLFSDNPDTAVAARDD